MRDPIFTPVGHSKKIKNTDYLITSYNSWITDKHMVRIFGLAEIGEDTEEGFFTEKKFIELEKLEEGKKIEKEE